MALVTADDLRDWLGQEDGDTYDQTNMTTAAAAADRDVKTWCRREFEDAGSASVRWFERLSSTVVLVDDFHTSTGFVLATDDNDDGTAETTWSASDYQLEPVNRTVDGVTWPYTAVRAVNGRRFPCNRRRTQVSVTAQWGFSETVPGDVTLAALMQAGRLFRRKDSPHGVSGTGEFGVVRVAQRMDPDVQALLKPYRRPLTAPGAVLIGG